LKERIREKDELVEAIHAVARGGSVVDPLIVDALIQARRREARQLDLLETEPARDTRCQQARAGNADLPRRGGHGRRLTGEPPVWLKSNDTMRIAIESLGEIEHRVE
jgi:hypothetical protein